MKRKIFILVPTLDQSSAPVKGAIALAKGLGSHYDLTLVSLNKVKKCPAAESSFKVTSLESSKGFWSKYQSYKKMLTAATNGSGLPVSISFTFPADRMNVLHRKRAIVLSSIRVNLARTYWIRYGIFGYLLSSFHLLILRFFAQALSMSDSMSHELCRFGIKNITLTGNFVDEPYLSLFKEEPALSGDVVHFLFVGRLTKLKQPKLLIQAVKKLTSKGLNCKLSIVGDGPLRKLLEDMTQSFKLYDRVSFLGHVPDPYHSIQQADYFVLPSLSEGISRASLEALFFGTPCILRDVGGAAELIESGVNGYLFGEDVELLELMTKIAREFIPNHPRQRKCLLPALYRFDEGVSRYSRLIESL